MIEPVGGGALHNNDRRLDGRMDRWMDGQVDGQTHDTTQQAGSNMACNRLRICGEEGTLPGKRTKKGMDRPDQPQHQGTRDRERSMERMRSSRRSEAVLAEDRL